MPSEVKIQIPEEMIVALVQTEIVKALGKQDEMIACVVRAAMEAKKDNYSRNTLFVEKAQELIRKTAIECFEQWLQENCEKIRAALIAELNAKKGARIKEIVAGFADQMGRIRFDLHAFMKDE